MTGRYPQRNGLYEMIRNNEVNFKYLFTEAEYALTPEMTLGLDVREVTIGQALREAGYATGIVGKWDSGRARRYLPLQRGFDFFYGFANTGIDYYSHERYGVPSMFRGNERVKEEGHATDLFCREAKRFIRENKDRPFFLYLPFNAPHAASTYDKKAAQAPEKYRRMYGEGTEWKTQFKAVLTQFDDAVGEILGLLRELGLERETLVVFASDNGGGGGSVNAPLRGAKATMFEGGLRVPLLARWPGRIGAGRVLGEFGTSLDLFPTFLEVAGAAGARGVKLDGKSLLGWWEGKGVPVREEMYWHKASTGSRAARVGKWKWVEDQGHGGLFDLGADVGERRDVGRENPEVLAMMKRKWEGWWKEMEAAEARGPFRDY